MKWRAHIKNDIASINFQKWVPLSKSHARAIAAAFKKALGVKGVKWVPIILADNDEEIVHGTLRVEEPDKIVITVTQGAQIVAEVSEEE